MTQDCIIPEITEEERLTAEEVLRTDRHRKLLLTLLALVLTAAAAWIRWRIRPQTAPMLCAATAFLPGTLIYAAVLTLLDRRSANKLIQSGLLRPRERSEEEEARFQTMYTHAAKQKNILQIVTGVPYLAAMILANRHPLVSVLLILPAVIFAVIYGKRIRFPKDTQTACTDRMKRQSTVCILGALVMLLIIYALTFAAVFLPGMDLRTLLESLRAA